MDRRSKYITHEHHVGKHLELQSGLAFFVVVMGLLFWLDAAAGMQTYMSLATIAFGIAWFFVHNAYVHWHEHHDHLHH